MNEQNYETNYEQNDVLNQQTQGYGYNQNQYNTYDEPPKESMGFGITSLVLGIISLVLFCTCVNIPLAIAAIIFGIIHLVKCRGGKVYAIGGIVTAVLSVIALFVMFFAVGRTIDFTEEFEKEFNRQMEEALEEEYDYSEDEIDDILDELEKYDKQEDDTF